MFRWKMKYKRESSVAAKRFFVTKRGVASRVEGLGLAALAFLLAIEQPCSRGPASRDLAYRNARFADGTCRTFLLSRAFASKWCAPGTPQSEGLAGQDLFVLHGYDLILRKTRKDPIGFSGFTNRPTLFSFRHP